MGKITAATLFLIVITLVVLILFGLRIHPEAIFERATYDPENHTFVELRLTNGSTVTAELKEESESGVTVIMDGSEIVFTKSEVAEVRVISHEETGTAGGESAVSLIAEKKPIITFRKEDSLFKILSQDDINSRYKDYSSKDYQRAEKARRNKAFEERFNNMMQKNAQRELEAKRKAHAES